jgi:integrase
MGHESIKTTTEIYGHWLEDEARDQEIADKMWGPS